MNDGPAPSPGLASRPLRPLGAPGDLVRPAGRRGPSAPAEAEPRVSRRGVWVLLLLVVALAAVVGASAWYARNVPN